MTRALKDYPVTELKLAYRLLHDALLEHPDLLDSALLGDLQDTLQHHARAAGVDATLHGDWDDWLRMPHD